MLEKAIRSLSFENNVACNAMWERSFTALDSFFVSQNLSSLHILNNAITTAQNNFHEIWLRIFQFRWRHLYFLGENFRDEIFERKRNYRCRSNKGEKMSNNTFRYRAFVCWIWHFLEFRIYLVAISVICVFSLANKSIQQHWSVEPQNAFTDLIQTVLACVPSSASVERLLSVAGSLKIAERNRLGASNLSNFIIIKYNQNTCSSHEHWQKLAELAIY